jgi:hypothetical protein
MKSEHKVVPPLRGDLICSVPRATLRALLMVARVLPNEPDLDCIHVVPSQGRLVAANAQMMLWVRVNMYPGPEPFTLSGALCQDALAASKDTVEIRIDSLPDEFRRRIFIHAEGTEFGELENLVTYRDPRAILEIPTTTRAVDFDPTVLAWLRSTISLVVGSKDEPLHVIARGSAPAIVACRSPYVMGFIAPWEATENGDRWTKTTLGEFGITPAQCLPATHSG